MDLYIRVVSWLSFSDFDIPVPESDHLEAIVLSSSHIFDSSSSSSYDTYGVVSGVSDFKRTRSDDRTETRINI